MENIRVSSKLIEFLCKPETQECIDRGDWKTLYKLVSSHVIGELTQLLYRTGLDPLTGLTRLPPFFLSETDIKSFTVPNGIKFMGYGVFGNCADLESISIPSSVIAIGDEAFTNCDNLKSVYITDITAWCAIDFYSSTSNPLSNECDLYLNSQPVTGLTIPEEVTVIRDYAFYGCNSFINVTIGNGVASIGRWAFYACNNLKDITYKGTVVEWKKVGKAETFDSLVTIHCSDGDVRPSGNRWVKV